MDLLIHIAPWVLGSVAIGIGVGFLVGRTYSRPWGPEDTTAEGRAVLKMLNELLGAAEQIVTNVAHHNSEIEENVQQVDRIHVTGELETIKQTLVCHMAALLASNKVLQEDLVCTRYRLEEQAQEIDSARQEARRDELTSVANRRAFDEKLHLLVDRWRREGEPFTLLLADLDEFKWVNDSHGHQAGDRVLKAAGNGLKQLARECDFVGRYGGDEFAILMPGANYDVGAQLAHDICRGIAGNAFAVAVRGGAVSISFSMGVAFSRSGDTDESILQRADEALYRSKHTGRNHVACEKTEVVPLPV
jgi:diguanylate cyclase